VKAVKCAPAATTLALLKMPKHTLTFEIDDGLTVDQTITVFGEALRQADPQLAEALVPMLSEFSLEIMVDQDQLLDALYAATVQTPVDASTPGSEPGEGE